MNYLIEALKNENIKIKIIETLSSYNLNLLNFHSKYSDENLIFQDVSNHIQKQQDKMLHPRLNRDRLDDILNDISHYSINSYLDFGCHDGIQSDYLFNKLKLNESNYYGIDIENHIQSDSINFLDYNNSNEIPLKEKTIDLVTCFMSLHHVDDIFHYLRNIYKKLSDGGILFIRETNLTTQEDFIFNQAMEVIYYKILGESEHNSYPYNLKSIEQWITIFVSLHFKVLEVKQVEDWNHFSPYHIILQK